MLLVISREVLMVLHLVLGVIQVVEVDLMVLQVLLTGSTH